MPISLCTLAAALCMLSPDDMPIASSSTLSPLYPHAIAPQQLPGLTIMLGEAWIFRVEQGQPAGARAAKPDDKPGEGEIRVTLDRDQRGVMMVVTNNSGEWYNYRAFISAKAGHKGNRTSVCTLMPGERISVEMWPEPFPAIRIADFTEARDGELRCQ